MGAPDIPSQSKQEAASLDPVLLAGGAVATEDWLRQWRAPRERSWPKAAILTVAVITGLLAAPLVLPILPPEKYLAYQRALEVGLSKTEVAHSGPLPQMFGDEFGWEQLVSEVARIYYALPPEERAQTGIFANNYGEAGALDMFGPKYGLIVLQDSRETMGKRMRIGGGAPRSLQSVGHGGREQCHIFMPRG